MKIKKHMYMVDYFSSHEQDFSSKKNKKLYTNTDNHHKTTTQQQKRLNLSFIAVISKSLRKDTQIYGWTLY